MKPGVLGFKVAVITMPLTLSAQSVTRPEVPLMVDPPSPAVDWSGVPGEPSEAELLRAQAAVRPLLGRCRHSNGRPFLETGAVQIAFRRDGRVAWTWFDRWRHLGAVPQCVATELRRMRVPPFFASYHVVVMFPIADGSK